MQRQVDEEIKKLKQKILSMGGEVEKVVEEATQALLLREPSRLQRVFELEKRINRDHIEVDEDCLKLLATQSPLAADLRMVIAVIKINNDLERMGDQAVNIAFNAEKYFKAPELKPLIDIPKMAEKVRLMIRSALDALVNADALQAQRVLDMDDEVDLLKNQVFDELIEYMEHDTQAVKRAMCLILIARNLERLGDHATNIAEDVIFATTGKDVRHRSSESMK